MPFALLAVLSCWAAGNGGPRITCRSAQLVSVRHWFDAFVTQSRFWAREINRTVCATRNLKARAPPRACQRNMREFVLFCDLAKDHCPTKKEAPGVSRSFALAGLSFRKRPSLAIARAADPPDAASTCFRSAKRNEHSHRPVIARITRVQAAAHKSWIAADFPFQSKRPRSASRDLR
jgi:hypothetical protein